MNRELWSGRRVFVTGHTGFKGAWLTAWLRRLGARVTGYALPPDTQPNLFEAAAGAEGMTSVMGDVRDFESLRAALGASQPEVVFHLAAQPLVRESYVRPVETYATNVMGTVHLLEAIRATPSVRAAVIVTTDKCYENREWVWAYRENEPLGGRDPYSNSKACAELVTSAYRASFFSQPGSAAIATARAGNVIGGGDWARDRLVPDLIRSFHDREPAIIRNPAAIRPWQHVLDPLHGYLLLAERLLNRADGAAEAWNFGPYESDSKSVAWIADALVRQWGGNVAWKTDDGAQPHEAMTLKLDSSRARTLLGWSPRLTLETALEWIVQWHKGFAEAPSRAATLLNQQIAAFENL